jgi:subtilase family serine protease
VTYLASTGDAPGVSFPSTSAYVVAVGGTAIRRNRVTGNFGEEVVWQDAGAGLSAYVARPAYQNGISSTVGASRGVPDIAAIANPSGGVWVYSGLNGGWVIVGGTSVASPVEAGIMSYQGYKICPGSRNVDQSL